MPTLTVYTAAAGTPIAGSSTPSAFGHTWFSTSNGTTTSSYGFEPATPNTPWGHGLVEQTDTQLYNNGVTSGLYQVATVTISAAQYSTLQAFGQSAIAAAPGSSFTSGGVTFAKEYDGLGNSCVDFVWAGLSTIGISQPAHPPGLDVLPTWNSDAIATALTTFSADGGGVAGFGIPRDVFNSSGQITSSTTYNANGTVASTTTYTETTPGDGSITGSATVKNGSGQVIGTASVIFNGSNGQTTDNTGVDAPATGTVTATQDISSPASSSTISDAITGTSAIVPLSGATIDTTATRTGLDGTILGSNDTIVAGSAVFGKGGLVGSTLDVEGKGDTITGYNSNVTLLGNNDSVTVNTLTTSVFAGGSYSSFNGGGTVGDTVTFDGWFDKVTGVGTGDILNINGDYYNATLAASDTVNLASNTSLDDIVGSSDTIHEGSSSDAKIIGSSDTITLGTGDNILASGSGDHISGSSGDVIDLSANETVTITASGETIVGMTGDTINVTGTSDHIYADSSNIEISGTDTGDVVYGAGDTGDRSDWGGYVNEGGGYGGYGGGGYYYAATARKNRAKAANSGTSITGGRLNGSSSVGIEALAAYDGAIGSSPMNAAYTRRPLVRPPARVTDQMSVDASPLLIANAHESVHQLVHAMATWQARAVGGMSSEFSAPHPWGSEHLLAAAPSRVMRPCLSVT